MSQRRYNQLKNETLNITNAVIINSVNLFNKTSHQAD
jgi:hypothetical protein